MWTKIGVLYWKPTIWISESEWVQKHSNGKASLIWLIPVWILAPIFFWGTALCAIVALVAIMLH